MISAKREKAATPSRAQKIEEILLILGKLYESVLTRPDQPPAPAPRHDRPAAPRRRSSGHRGRRAEKS